MTYSEAIEVLKKNYPDPCYESLQKAVDTAIYALSDQHWIPCNKRQPNEVGLYLVTLEHGKCVTALWYFGKQDGWDLCFTDTVIAWMPLPKPYGVICKLGE